MLCFSRDSEVLQLLPEPSGCIPVTLKGKQQTTENTLMYPPNGVIPFYGFTMYGKFHKLLLNTGILTIINFSCTVLLFVRRQCRFVLRISYILLTILSSFAQNLHSSPKYSVFVLIVRKTFTVF